MAAIERNAIHDLIIRTSDGHTIYFYKAYMALNFDMYNTLFKGNFSDSNHNTIDVEVNLEEMEIIAAYCVTKNLNAPVSSNYMWLVNITIFADKYQGSDLKKACEEYIVKDAEKIVVDFHALDKLVVYRSTISKETLNTIKGTVDDRFEDCREHISKNAETKNIFHYTTYWSETITLFMDHLTYKGNKQETVDEICEHMSKWDLRGMGSKELYAKVFTLIQRCSNPNTYKIMMTLLVEGLLQM